VGGTGGAGQAAVGFSCEANYFTSIISIQIEFSNKIHPFNKSSSY
jgi:hypothetical protein